MKLRIDPAFQAAITPLTNDERAQLEANVLEHGCRDALVLWHETGALLDGHHRYAICEAHGLPFQTVEVSLPDRESALDWIDANQLGRRNLTPDQFTLLLGRRYNRSKRNQGGTGANQYVQSGQNVHSAKTAERLGEQHGVDERTVRRAGAFAEAVEVLAPLVPELPQALATGTAPAKRAILDAAVVAKEFPGQAQEILRADRHHRTQFTGDNEWYTPIPYLDAVREVLGHIDLDPASSDAAQAAVQARQYYTANSDGLQHSWYGRVWLNPPYAQPLIGQFLAHLIAEWQRGHITEAITLTHNYTDTTWFHATACHAQALCFPRGRIRFVSPAGDLAAPTQGQVFLYFGPAPERFAAVFSALGLLLHRMTPDG